MRLDPRGDSILESVGIALGVVPAPLILVTFGIGYSRAIVAGTRLGVFEALRAGPLDLSSLATQLQCSEIGLRALLNALTGFGVLRRKAGRYQNAPDATRWLLADAERSLRDGVLFLGYCHELLADLEDRVRSGELRRIHDLQHPPAFWDAYMGALSAFARLVQGDLVRKSSLDKGRQARLLDVGGGHGLYAAAFCKKHPELRGEVLDLPGSCVAGRRIIAAEGMSERVTHREGDFRQDPWGEDLDIIILANILHNATADECEALMARAFAALRPGGTLLVCDGVHKGDEGKLDASSGWNELFFFQVSGAQLWPEPRIRAWAEAAGFQIARRAVLLAAPNFVLSLRRPSLG